LRGVRASPPCALASTCTGLALPVPRGCSGCSPACRRAAAAFVHAADARAAQLQLLHVRSPCPPACTCAGPSAHGPRRGSTAVFGAVAASG
jgi:hypothetical protein